MQYGPPMEQYGGGGGGYGGYQGESPININKNIKMVDEKPSYGGGGGGNGYSAPTPQYGPPPAQDGYYYPQQPQGYDSAPQPAGLPYIEAKGAGSSHVPQATPPQHAPSFGPAPPGPPGPPHHFMGPPPPMGHMPGPFAPPPAHGGHPPMMNFGARLDHGGAPMYGPPMGPPMPHPGHFMPPPPMHPMHFAPPQHPQHFGPEQHHQPPRQNRHQGRNSHNKA